MCLVMSVKLFYLCIFLHFVTGHVKFRRSHLVHGKDLSNPTRLHKDICKDPDYCVPFVQCPSHVRSDVKKTCKTTIGREGVCCSTGQNHTARSTIKPRDHAIHMDSATMGVVARHSQAKIEELRLREARFLEDGHLSIVFPGSASYGHFRNFKLHGADLSEVLDLASRAMEIALATRDFKNRQVITNEQIELGMLEEDLRPTLLGPACPTRPECPAYPVRYRKIDGTCNNLLYPAWGSGMTPYSRLLPPSYHDGIWVPRFSTNGDALISPRRICTEIISDKDAVNYDATLMVMQFGQFLSHDITQSIETSFANGSAISCCSSDGTLKLSHEERHFACMAIDIPEDDAFYSHFNQNCMNFVRSVLAPRQDCTLGYAQQMNKITHFIDASSIYGSNPERTGELRSFEKGKLRVFKDFGRDLLPLSKDEDACLTMEQGSACFTSGDTRTNQMISLVVLHTIFVREHNRIAEQLAKINPHWNDEKLFLETRQIIIAILQVIIYKEFLPVVLGDIAMEEFKLHLAKDGNYAQDYDETIEPSITNEFASAAFRFGHSIVDGVLKISGKDRVEEMIAISEVMFQPNRMRKFFFMDKLLSTLTTEPIQEVDHNFAEALTRYMFRAGNAFGIDLASLNIQRGRDHGLRPYNDYRELVGLPKMQSFEQLNPKMSEKLKNVYTSVDDIDLWVGGLLEEKAPGSIIGYTFRDIIADQFYRLKKGDRYFFENDPSINPGFFTPEQLIELRKASLSRVVCDNSDGSLLGRQARNAFRKPGVQGNEFFDCAGPDIPRVNLVFWRD